MSSTLGEDAGVAPSEKRNKKKKWRSANGGWTSTIRAAGGRKWSTTGGTVASVWGHSRAVALSRQWAMMRVRCSTRMQNMPSIASKRGAYSIVSPLFKPLSEHSRTHSVAEVVEISFCGVCGVVEPSWHSFATLESAGVLERTEERRVGKECKSWWSSYH